MLAVENITKRFATPEGTLSALEGVAVDVPKGRFVALIGPSGCGKSTLFNIIG
jgi:NitT/TauT family transport system ATP-binding protein